MKGTTPPEMRFILVIKLYPPVQWRALQNDGRKEIAPFETQKKRKLLSHSGTFRW